MSSSAAASAADASASPSPQMNKRKTRSQTIRVISYNISMARPSAQAPSHWAWGAAGSASSSPNGDDYGRRYEHASDLLSAILGQDHDDDDAPRASSTNANTCNASSPSNSKNLTKVEVRLRNEILRTQPDIIALQECPTRNWPTRVICAPTNHQYVSVGTAPSHCGYVDLLVRSDWKLERIDLQQAQHHQGGGMPLPSVAAVINMPFLEADNSSSSSSFARLAISSSHLAPHRENASTRFDQLQRLVCQMEQQDVPGATDLILLGDMNMRKDEDGRVERIGWAPPSASKSGSISNGGLLDAWKEAGSDPATRDTWNSYVNRYHGADAFEFRCRFDRTYYRPAAGSSLLRVVDFGLVGNRPILRDQGGGGSSHFLSDHFGMRVTFEVARSEDTCNDDGDNDGDGDDDGDGDGGGAPGSETQPSKKKTKL